jgi:hypothetical protein
MRGWASRVDCCHPAAQQRRKGPKRRLRSGPFRALSALGVATFLVTACNGTLPPLRGQIDIGREGYVIFVGGGSVAGGDLYAVRTEGGAAIPITFTTVGEMRPALSPDGVAVAFLRGGSLRDSVPSSVWVLNLLNGSERELSLPKEAGKPVRVAWGTDGPWLVVAAEHGLYRADAPADAPRLRRAPEAERLAAESSLSVLVGKPVFGRVVPCAEAGDLCVQADTGSPGLLSRGARDPARWGDDSVAYLAGGALWIRPVGPGRARRLEWSNAVRPRQITVFVGPGE